MSVKNGIKNKIAGKTKQMKGSVNQQRGKGIKGGMQKIEGKIQEKIGETEMKTTTKKNTPLKK